MNSNFCSHGDYFYSTLVRGITHSVAKYVMEMTSQFETLVTFLQHLNSPPFLLLTSPRSLPPVDTPDTYRHHMCRYQEPRNLTPKKVRPFIMATFSTKVGPDPHRSHEHTSHELAANIHQESAVNMSDTTTPTLPAELRGKLTETQMSRLLLNQAERSGIPESSGSTQGQDNLVALGKLEQLT